MPSQLPVFLAYYSKSWGCGEWEDHTCVIVANTQSEALGIALERYSGTESCYWTLLPVDTTRVHLVEP